MTALAWNPTSGTRSLAGRRRDGRFVCLHCQGKVQQKRAPARRPVFHSRPHQAEPQGCCNSSHRVRHTHSCKVELGWSAAHASPGPSIPWSRKGFTYLLRGFRASQTSRRPVFFCGGKIHLAPGAPWCALPRPRRFLCGRRVLLPVGRLVKLLRSGLLFSSLDDDIAITQVEE